MIALVEGAEPPEDAQRDRPQHPAGRAHDHLPAGRRDAAAVRRSTPDAEQNVIVLVALLVCLIPTTIGALLSAIGIAGMDRLVQRNVLAMSGRAVEAAGDVLDAAAGQDRHDHARQPPGRRVPPAARRRPSDELADAAQLVEPRRRDPRGPLDRRARRGALRPPRARARRAPTLVPFTAQTRMSGVDLDGRRGPQGRRRLGRALGRGAAAARSRDGAGHHRRRHRRPAAARRWSSPSRRRRADRGAGRHPPQGHRQGGHAPSASTSCGPWASAR